MDLAIGSVLVLCGAEGKMGEDVHLTSDGSEERLETFVGG